MGRVAAIERTHHTFTGWMGCTKLESSKHASACDNCYAANMAGVPRSVEVL